MNAKSTTATEVEIFGSVYHVRGQTDDGRLQELASRVDAKMREIAGNVATVDTAKIAILTALNLADELAQCERRQDGAQEKIQERVERLTGRLAEAISS